MSVDTCIFCKIIAEEIPATFVYKDDKIVVFKDIRPKAPVHLLIVPRTHIKSLIEVDDHHADLVQYMLMSLPQLAKEQGLTQGFRTVCNTGPGGGQEVDHIHFHLLGAPSGEAPSSFL